ncbi:MAG: NAD(P)H-hydrate epimerase, partial [Candidatus Dormibacteria bacterium]
MSSSLQRRLGSLTSEQASRLDAAAVDLGVGIVQLMEVAGFQVARCAWRMLGRRAARVHVVAGHGHNGGDGLVSARHLAGWGCEVTVGVLGDPEALDPLLLEQAAAAGGAGALVHVSEQPTDLVGRRDGIALIVDALLGTGLRRPPRPAYQEIIGSMHGPVLSI